jgi:hypothetical protein
MLALFPFRVLKTPRLAVCQQQELAICVKHEEEFTLISAGCGSNDI